MPLPIELVLTRWGTWFEAELYYAEHFESLRRLIKCFESDYSVYVRNAQEAFADEHLLAQLVNIKAH